jgi:hypothetical protein
LAWVAETRVLARPRARRARGRDDMRVRAVRVRSGGTARDLLGLEGRLGGFGGFGEDERHRLGGEVAALHQPLVVLLQAQRAGEPDTAWSLGKIPTTSERRPISLFTRSSGFVERILVGVPPVSWTFER